MLIIKKTLIIKCSLCPFNTHYQYLQFTHTKCKKRQLVKSKIIIIIMKIKARDRESQRHTAIPETEWRERAERERERESPVWVGGWPGSNTGFFAFLKRALWSG
jgi:hypothetical protein